MVKAHTFALSFVRVKAEARLQTGCSGERSKGIFASRARDERMTSFGFNLLHGNFQKVDVPRYMTRLRSACAPLRLASTMLPPAR